MEEKLKNLQKSMNQTVLRHGSITPFEKSQIKNYVLNGKVKRDRYHRFTMFSLTMVVTLVFVMGIGLYLNNKIQILEQKMNTTIQGEESKNEVAVYHGETKIKYLSIKSGQGIKVKNMNVTNYAEGVIGEDKYTFYAGAAVPDLSTGVLHIEIQKEDGTTSTIRYLFDKKSPLVIDTVENNELVMHADTLRMYFDVIGRNIYYGYDRTERN